MHREVLSGMVISQDSCCTHGQDVSSWCWWFPKSICEAPELSLGVLITLQLCPDCWENVWNTSSGEGLPADVIHSCQSNHLQVVLLQWAQEVSSQKMGKAIALLLQESLQPVEGVQEKQHIGAQGCAEPVQPSVLTLVSWSFPIEPVLACSIPVGFNSTEHSPCALWAPWLCADCGIWAPGAQGLLAVALVCGGVISHCSDNGSVSQTLWISSSPGTMKTQELSCCCVPVSSWLNSNVLPLGPFSQSFFVIFFLIWLGGFVCLFVWFW